MQILWIRTSLCWILCNKSLLLLLLINFHTFYKTHLMTKLMYFSVGKKALKTVSNNENVMNMEAIFAVMNTT